MSKFSDLQHALYYINKAELKTLSTNLSTYIDRLISNYIKDEGYPEILTSILNLKLTYTLLKNRSWVQSQQFRSVLAQDLAIQFNLGIDRCRALIQQICFELARLIETNTNQHEDADRYLEFLFVMTATSNNLEAITHELGVSKTTIRQIRKAAECVFKGQHHLENSSIVNAMVKIVVTYAKRMKIIPWALDIARLEFTLPFYAKKWKLFHYNEGFSILFNALMFTSEQGKAKGSIIFDTFTEQFEQSGLSLSSEDIPTQDKFLELLIKSQLIYIETNKKLLRNSIYGLTDLGFELTASAFAFENKLDIEKNPARLLDVEEHYQGHLLQLMNKNALLNLVEHLDKDNSLAKSAIRIFAERMQYIGETHKLESILLEWMLFHPSYWIRESAVDASILLNSDNIRQSLQDVAKFDTSCAVQNKAIEVLMTPKAE